jgi:hypothetical protein
MDSRKSIEADRKRLYSIDASSALDDHTDAVNALFRLALEGVAAREALETISQWDVLNPHQTMLLSDLAWLRKVVDKGLGK